MSQILSILYFFQHWKVVTISAFPSFSPLAVLLLHYLCLYLDLIAPPLSSSITANRAERQMYLHWWRKGRKEEEVISRGPSAQPRRLWQAEQTVWLLPIQGISLSLCSPWASEFSAGWDQSLTRLTQSYISLSGIGSRRHSLQPALTPAADRFHKASDLFSLHHFSTRALDEAGCYISSSSRADQEGQSAHRKSNDFILHLLNTGPVLLALWLFWAPNTPYWYEASLDQVSHLMTLCESYVFFVAPLINLAKQMATHGIYRQSFTH